MEQKSKRTRFEEVAGARVQMVLDKLDNLSKCANKKNYEYTQIDIDNMFRAINNAMKMTKAKYESELVSGSRTKKIFKF